MSGSRKTWRVGQIRRRVTALHENARAAAHRIQEQAEPNTTPDSSPERYAGDQLRQGAETTVQRIKMTGGQAYRIVARKRRAAKAREGSIPEPAAPETGSVGRNATRTQIPRGSAVSDRIRAVNRSAGSVNKNSGVTTVSGQLRRQSVPSSNRMIREGNRTARTASRQATGRMARRSARASQKAARRAVKQSRAGAKAAAKSAKQAAKITVKTIKGMIKATKSLVAVIAAGGWTAVAVILIVCLA